MGARGITLLFVLIERAESDVGLMFIAYNLRRIINIIGKDNIMKHLQNILSRVLTFLYQIRMILSQNKGIKFQTQSLVRFLKLI
jgi:hypothetical protein